MVFIVFLGLYMFVYRYQYLSTTCPDIGTAWVQYLSTACPKIEHLDTAAFERVVRGFIIDIFPMAKLLDTTVIGGLGPYFGKIHDLFPIDIEGIPEKIIVP